MQGSPLTRAGIVAACLALIAAVALTGQKPQAARAQATDDACAAWMDPSKSPDERAHALVSKMSIDDKIQMVHQAEPVWGHYGAAGYIPGNPALCIPDLALNDAGQGVGDQ